MQSQIKVEESNPELFKLGIDQLNCFPYWWNGYIETQSQDRSSSHAITPPIPAWFKRNIYEVYQQQSAQLFKSALRTWVSSLKIAHVIKKDISGRMETSRMIFLKQNYHFYHKLNDAEEHPLLPAWNQKLFILNIKQRC